MVVSRRHPGRAALAVLGVLGVLGVLIASAIVDNSFGADPAWGWYVTYLTVGYMISRGLAKAGSRYPQDD